MFSQKQLIFVYVKQLVVRELKQTSADEMDSKWVFFPLGLGENHAGEDAKSQQGLQKLVLMSKVGSAIKKGTQ